MVFALFNFRPLVGISEFSGKIAASFAILYTLQTMLLKACNYRAIEQYRTRITAGYYVFPVFSRKIQT